MDNIFVFVFFVLFHLIYKSICSLKNHITIRDEKLTKKSDLSEGRSRMTGVSKDLDEKYNFLCILEHGNEDD